MSKDFPVTFPERGRRADRSERRRLSRSFAPASRLSAPHSLSLLSARFCSLWAEEIARFNCTALLSLLEGLGVLASGAQSLGTVHPRAVSFTLGFPQAAPVNFPVLDCNLRE